MLSFPEEGSVKSFEHSKLHQATKFFYFNYKVNKFLFRKWIEFNCVGDDINEKFVFTTKHRNH